MSFPRAGVLLIGFGGTVAVVLIGWIGAGAVGADIMRAGWAIPGCVAIHLLALRLCAAAWRRASGDRGLRGGTWFLIRWIREAVNALLPVAQLGGPVVGVRLLAQRGLATRAAAAGTLLDMTLEALAQLPFTLAGLLVLAIFGEGSAWPPWLAAMLGLAVGGGGALVVAWRAGLPRLVALLAGRVGGLVSARAAGALDGLHVALRRRQRDKAGLVAAAALHLLAWTVGAAETWLALWAMGYPTGPLAALAVESLGAAARSIGFAIPGAIGVQEGGLMLAGDVAGLPPDAALALAMVKRARELLVGLPGLLLWQWAEGRRLLRRPAAAPGLRG
jgi:putative membrane protein